MSTVGKNTQVSNPAPWLRRALSGLVILSVVMETMDRIGYGFSETLARILGGITIACTILYGIPPTSILGAILWSGYLGGAMVSHLRIDSPLFSQVLFGFYLALMVWGAFYLRDGSLRTPIFFRR